MDPLLQQRIVGAIVLVTLGVIFIPALLDGSGYKTRQTQDIEVKDKPTFPVVIQNKLKPIATPLDDNKLSQTKALLADSKRPDLKPIKSFALQVGTFSTTKNANKLRDKLRKAGYTTFVHKTQSKGKTGYSVRIGPELEFDVLKKIKKNIKKTHKIDGYIVNHP